MVQQQNETNSLSGRKIKLKEIAITTKHMVSQINMPVIRVILITKFGVSQTIFSLQLDYKVYSK